jgi:SAM-dependent methyltransferase
MDVNYRFWVAYVQERRPASVLDFGCGDGIVVRALREAGIDCYGTDVFYGGMDYDEGALKALVDDAVIRPYSPAEPLPFADDSFDLIISNMVLEHVADLEYTAAEFDRILKPGGVMRHHFPSRAVLREGHIGIPLAHWFSPGPLRTGWTLALSALGLGTDRDGPAREWTRKSLDWVDRYCYYRPYREVERAFERFAIHAREADYCRFRAQSPLLRRALSRWEPLQTVLLRRLGFMALEMRRREPA